MNTQENNKMIAEFMGLIIRDKDGNLPTSSQQYKLFVEEEWDKLYLASPYSPNGLDYHEYWDWLMPVVDKIEDVSEGFKWVEVEWISYTFQIENKSVTIWKHSDRFDSKRIIEINGNTKREATYKAVVEFINQYNKNK